MYDKLSSEQYKHFTLALGLLNGVNMLHDMFATAGPIQHPEVQRMLWKLCISVQITPFLRSYIIG